MQEGSTEVEGFESWRLELGSVGLRGRLRFLQPLLLADPFCYRSQFRFADSPKIRTPRKVRDSGMFEWVEVGPSRSRGCFTHSCSGVLVALPTLGSSKPELDEGLVCLSTGCASCSHPCGQSRVYSLPVGAPASRRLPSLLGTSLRTPGLPSFGFRQGLSHTS